MEKEPGPITENPSITKRYNILPHSAIKFQEFIVFYLEFIAVNHANIPFELLKNP